MLTFLHCIPVMPLGILPLIAAALISAGGSIIAGTLSGKDVTSPINTGDEGDKNYSFVVGRGNKVGTGSTPAAALPTLADNALAQNIIPLGVAAVVVVVALVLAIRKK